MSSKIRKLPEGAADRAGRLVEEVRSEHESERATIESVASKLGFGLRKRSHNG